MQRTKDFLLLLILINCILLSTLSLELIKYNSGTVRTIHSHHSGNFFRLYSTTVTRTITSEKENISNLSNKVFLGNLPFSITEAEVRAIVNECECGMNMKLVSVPRGKKSKKGMGYAFVDFSTVEAAIDASSKINGYVLKDRVINSNVKDIASVEASKSKPVKRNRDNSIYLANLDQSLSEEEIITMCNDILASEEDHAQGTVQNLVVSIEKPVDRSTGEARGFAYIEFAGKDVVEKAVTEFNNLEVLGAMLFCLPMQKQKKKIMYVPPVEEEDARYSGFGDHDDDSLDGIWENSK